MKKLWNSIHNRLKQSPRTKSLLQFLLFVFISAIFWGFLTFNRSIKFEVEVPVTISVPENIHLIDKVPDTLTVTVEDRGYQMFTYMLVKRQRLTLRFSDYCDTNSGMFKIGQSHLKKELASVFRKHTTIVSVLPESISIKYTDLPGKKVPIRTDITVKAREDHIQNGLLILSQDSVLIYGDAQTLSGINEVFTYHVEETDLTDTLRRSVTISPIKGAVIEPRSIDIVVPIEKLVSQTRTVNIVVRNAPPGVRMLLFPGDVEVTYSSPMSRIKDDGGITAVVDYNSVNFKSGSNKVKVNIGEAPAVFLNVKTAVDSVDYIIEKSLR